MKAATKLDDFELKYDVLPQLEMDFQAVCIKGGPGTILNPWRPQPDLPS